MEMAPLVSGSPPMASVAASPTSSDPVVSPSPGLPMRPSEPGLPVQRAVDILLQRESPGMPAPTIAAPQPRSDMDHTDDHRTVTDESTVPTVVGLVGDRPIESMVTDYAAAPAARQTRWPPVQRRAAVEGQVTGAHVSRARVLAATSVQRSVGTGVNPAASWPPDALAVSRSSSGVNQQEPTQSGQFVQFAAATPVASGSNPPELSTELLVQRAPDEPADTPATETGPPAATGAAAGTPPAAPVGSTSPTEVDTLVRRLYDPIARRLKAELQRDRERAGRSLDLRH